MTELERIRLHRLEKKVDHLDKCVLVLYALTGLLLAPFVASLLQ